MISTPEDYGLSPAETLAHRVQSTPPDDFDEFWTTLADAAKAMPARGSGLIDAPVNQLLFRSLGDVRIVGELHVPDQPPTGLVVTTHGYRPSEPGADEGERPVTRWTDRGLALLRVWVRGFGPSTADVPALGIEWILHKIESADDWILRGAVVDLATACRAVRLALPGLPLTLHGTSFGGGLAVLAGALLERLDAGPDRLILELPSLGDWAWRSGRYCNGAGGLVNGLLEALREDRARVERSLRLLDAALVAPQLRAPALVKLACLDDVVPAPAAASVFNALSSAPKLRFVTRYGHFDGGIADGRRHAQFERLAPEFADPGVDPGESFGPRNAHALDPQGLAG